MSACHSSTVPQCGLHAPRSDWPPHRWWLVGWLSIELMVVGLGGFRPMSLAAAEPRYVAVWTDGSATSAAELADWNTPDLRIRLGDRPLFDSARPVRMLRDTTVERGEPTAFVEYHGGDRIVARVVGYRRPSELPAAPRPGQLRCEPNFEWGETGGQRPEELRLSTERLRRIVWQSRTLDDYQPSTVFYRDGRQLAFRSLRWTETGVRLLLEQETTVVPFEQLAELHLPRVDAWAVWRESLAELLPTGAGRIVRIATNDGLVVTTSTDRLRVRASRSSGDLQRAWVLLQPPAALEPLAIRLRDVWQWTTWAAEELPLSALEPDAVSQRPILGTAWKRPRVDRNVYGGPLSLGDRQLAWGLGTFGTNALTFSLPHEARRFRTHFGLAPSLQPHGCARGVIELLVPRDSAETDLQELLRTRVCQPPHAQDDTDWLPLASVAAGHDVPRQLRLRVEAEVEPLPAGAEPWDIGDAWNWGEPLLELDRPRMVARLANDARSALPGLDDWHASGPGAATAQVVTVANEPVEQGPFRLGLTLPDTLVLQRKVTVTAQQPVLALGLSHAPQQAGRPVRATITVAGVEQRSDIVPLDRPTATPAPWLIRLDGHIGQEVTIEMTLLGGPDAWPLLWTGAALVELNSP